MPRTATTATSNQASDPGRRQAGSHAEPGEARRRPGRADAEPGPSDRAGRFLDAQRQLLLDERANYLRSAEELKAQADSLALEHEPGDVQFDEEGGEGGTSNVDRELDLVLSAQARAAASRSTGPWPRSTPAPTAPASSVASRHPRCPPAGPAPRRPSASRARAAGCRPGAERRAVTAAPVPARGTGRRPVSAARRLGLVGRGAVVAVDQLTKTWAVRLSSTAAGPRHVVGPVWLDLTYNSGAAFSLGRGVTPVVEIVVVVVLVSGCSLFGRRAAATGRALGAVGLGLLLGGAARQPDRPARPPQPGAVIDFIDAAADRHQGLVAGVQRGRRLHRRRGRSLLALAFVRRSAPAAASTETEPREP